MEGNKIISFCTEVIGGIIYTPYDPYARGIHFLVGSIIQYVSIRLNNPLLGFLLVVLLATVKELFDLYKDGRFDVLDLIITVLGAIIIFLITKTPL